MYGWRARMAVVMPHSNTTVEPEFGRLAPDGVSIHGSRVRIAGVSATGIATDDDSVEAASRLLADINARVIAYACNGANVVAGLEAEARLARKISNMSGRPTVMA